MHLIDKKCNVIC